MSAQKGLFLMTKVVLDTNIVISAALSPNGNPAKIIKLISSDESIQMYYSPEIINEYFKVLSYQRLSFSEEKKNHALNIIKNHGVTIQPSESEIELPDESDRIFYDAAKAADAYLVTGNIKHYPDESHILTPTEFLKMLGQL
jgi:putative PIN family toxin of toxin-antitoxin system